MRARRMPARKFDREEVVAYIHGITPTCEVVHILVHKRGDSIKLSGTLGKHEVSNENKSALEAWVLEAANIWNLSDPIGIPRGWNIPETLQKIEMLKDIAAERKKELNVLSQL